MSVCLSVHQSVCEQYVCKNSLNQLPLVVYDSP